MDNKSKVNFIALSNSLTQTVIMSESSNMNQKSKYWSQILAIFVVSLAPLSIGLLFAWSSPFSVVITSDKEHYNITLEEVSYFIVAHPIGLFITIAILLLLGDRLSPKKTFWLMSIPHTASWIITIFAKSKWEFYGSRLLAGLGDALYYTAGPSYIGEISSPTVRGYFGNVPSIAINLGLFSITALGSYLSIATTAYICIGCPILLGVLMFFLPESPYQLIKTKKYDEAKQSLKWLTRKPNVDIEFLLLKADLDRQLSEKGNFKDLFTIKSNVKAIRAAFLLRFSQQFSGIPVFSNYTQMIFQMAGGSLTPQASSMIFIGVCTTVILACSVSAERFGRKRTYFWSILACAVVLLAMSLGFGLNQYDKINMDQIRWFPLTGMIVYVFVYAPGVGLIPTLMLTELFSSSIKSKAMCLILFVFAVAQLLSTYVFTLLNTSVGLYAPFLFYGICCLTAACLSLIWVPETKGKTLEEIQQDLKKS